MNGTFNESVMSFYRVFTSTEKNHLSFSQNLSFCLDIEVWILNLLDSL